MRLALILAAAALSLMAQPTWACRQPIPSAKFQNSDIVLDGVANCHANIQECELKVLRVRKGDVRTGTIIRIAVDKPPPPEADPDVLIIGHCPQTFEPEQIISRGRFYLTVRSDQTFYASSPPDLKETKQ